MVERMFQETELSPDMMSDQDALLLEWLVTGGENEGLTDDEMLSAIPTLASPSSIPQESTVASMDPPRRNYVGRVNEGASTSGFHRGQKRCHDAGEPSRSEDGVTDDETDDGADEAIDLNNVSQFFKIDKVTEKFVKKFNATSSDHFVKFNNLDKLSANTFPIVLGKIIEKLIETLTDGMSGHDMVRKVISSELLDTPISLPFVRRRDLSVERIMAHIEKILQSHQEIILDEVLHLNFIHLKIPCGGGNNGIRNPGVDVLKFLKRKRSIIITPNTEDNLCCARAIVTAIARNECHPKWESIRKGWGIQLALARKLHRDAGVPEGLCGIDELQAFQTFLGKSLFMDITGKDIDNGEECRESGEFEEGDDDEELVTRKIGVDPFKQCITIASACNLVFRRNFMKPKSIAVFYQRQVQQLFVCSDSSEISVHRSIGD
ncbi:hypothetical protein HOLleu_26586 [Holothuria leucospilota]|uniref:Uncharacterized protein n=1 Tax=Holothuria leucospilota TaxID=206669 RepID=A0A9Q1H046_HOLLE|nr:hypothetical protein HOLleu_26586 [Holothuria leucospilota]